LVSDVLVQPDTAMNVMGGPAGTGVFIMDLIDQGIKRARAVRELEEIDLIIGDRDARIAHMTTEYAQSGVELSRMKIEAIEEAKQLEKKMPALDARERTANIEAARLADIVGRLRPTLLPDEGGIDAIIEKAVAEAVEIEQAKLDALQRELDALQLEIEAEESMATIHDARLENSRSGAEYVADLVAAKRQEYETKRAERIKEEETAERLERQVAAQRSGPN
jgi:hypothetical protein